jgi:[acyl-carrier-protein] S-malonyltransferase
VTNPVFMFSGQGSMKPGIGRDYFMSSKVFREKFFEASHFFKEDIQEICWGKKRTSLTSNPYYSHIALFCISYSLYSLLKAKNIRPHLLIGHSLGEIMSVIFSGAIDVSSGATLIAERGRLFLENKQCIESEMVAVSGEKQRVNKIVDGFKREHEIYCANVNTDSQIVYSLPTSSVPAFLSTCFKQGVKAVRLNIGNGCHSPFVKQIDIPLQKVISSIEVRTPTAPVYSASFNKRMTTGGEIKKALKKHLLAPVMWYNSITNVIKQGYSYFMNVSLSNVLKGLVYRIDKTVTIDSAENYIT